MNDPAHNAREWIRANIRANLHPKKPVQDTVLDLVRMLVRDRGHTHIYLDSIARVFAQIPNGQIEPVRPLSDPEKRLLALAKPAALARQNETVVALCVAGMARILTASGDGL